jgi:hypothetical protein
MSKVKLAVIYYSSTGTNHQLAKWAEEGGTQAGAEVLYPAKRCSCLHRPLSITSAPGR